jgi:hypothetical protein
LRFWPGSVRVDFSLAARSMIAASIAPRRRLWRAGCDSQTAGVSSPRMSSKSPLLLTLFGANP